MAGTARLVRALGIYQRVTPWSRSTGALNMTWPRAAFVTEPMLLPAGGPPRAGLSTTRTLAWPPQPPARLVAVSASRWSHWQTSPPSPVPPTRLPRFARRGPIPAMVEQQRFLAKAVSEGTPLPTSEAASASQHGESAQAGASLSGDATSGTNAPAAPRQDDSGSGESDSEDDEADALALWLLHDTFRLAGSDAIERKTRQQALDMPDEQVRRFVLEKIARLRATPNDAASQTSADNLAANLRLADDATPGSKKQYLMYMLLRRNVQLQLEALELARPQTPFNPALEGRPPPFGLGKLWLGHLWGSVFMAVDGMAAFHNTTASMDTWMAILFFVGYAALFDVQRWLAAMHKRPESYWDGSYRFLMMSAAVLSMRSHLGAYPLALFETMMAAGAAYTAPFLATTALLPKTSTRFRGVDTVRPIIICSALSGAGILVGAHWAGYTPAAATVATQLTFLAAFAAAELTVSPRLADWMMPRLSAYRSSPQRFEPDEWDHALAWMSSARFSVAIAAATTWATSAITAAVLS